MVLNEGEHCMFYYLQMMALSERFPCRQESCRRVSVTAPRAAPAHRRSVSWECVPRMRDSAHPPPASTQVRSSWYLSVKVDSSWMLTNAKSTSRKVVCCCAILVPPQWFIRNEPDRHQQSNLATTVQRKLQWMDTYCNIGVAHCLGQC